MLPTFALILTLLVPLPLFAATADTATTVLTNHKSDLPNPLPAGSELRLTQPNPAVTADDEIVELLDIGEHQLKSGDNLAAANSFLRALTLIKSQSLIDPHRQAEALQGLIDAYLNEDNYRAALPFAEEALTLYETLAAEEPAGFTWEKVSESDYANSLVLLTWTLGYIHRDFANFGTALNYFEQMQFSDRLEHQLEATQNIGLIQSDIGQYLEAAATLQSTLPMAREERDLCAEAISTSALGRISEKQQNYEQAIAQYQQALAMYQRYDETQQALAIYPHYDETQQPDCESATRKVRILNNIGWVHLLQTDYATAQDWFDQGMQLLMTEAENDPAERGILLGSIGTLHQKNGDLEQAWTIQLEALRLSQGISDTQSDGDKVNEIEVLSSLGQIMEAQEKPDLAIFFYKQAIAQIETIRQDLKQLERSVQQQNTLTIEDLYRHVADLLLQRNRTDEALEILELLKLQEIKSYFHSGQDDGKIFSTPAESALAEVFEHLPAETSLADFMQHPDAIALERTPDGTTFTLETIESLKAALAEQKLPTAVLYPLILKDRLEILLLTPDGEVQHFSQNVSRENLSNTVKELQKSLKNKAFDSQPSAQQLYEWLIQPLESELAAQGVQNIIYLPDDFLRYVPLAALHDGQQWFVEKYQSHNITAAAVGDLTRQSQPSTSVIAGALTDSSQKYEVTIGTDIFKFTGLSNAQQEIINLETALPDTLTLLNRDFTSERTLSAVANHQIIHLATHAKFIPGQPEESFILFGDGRTVNMNDIQSWKLPTVDLVVLSACQTATNTEGEGKEILGLGYQIQQTGAGAVIASLWDVDDSATAVLMSYFYQALSEGETKAQALQTAQISLINSDHGLSHPYDWAAFILIGNGL